LFWRGGGGGNGADAGADGAPQDDADWTAYQADGGTRGGTSRGSAAEPAWFAGPASGQQRGGPDDCDYIQAHTLSSIFVIICHQEHSSTAAGFGPNKILVIWNCVQVWRAGLVGRPRAKED